MNLNPELELKLHYIYPMITVLRTDSTHPEFRGLVDQLNAELSIRNGEKDAFYSQYNSIDMLKNTVVAYWEGQPAGSGAFKPFDEQSVEIKRMFVPPTLRGKGIAQAVLQELENWARELGYTATVLETGLMLPEAIRLYEKYGYSRIPNFGQYIGVESSVCFQKPL